MNKPNKDNDFSEPESPHFDACDALNEDTEAKAWEEIDPGRFMPRRVRGSNRGRALG